MAEGDASASPSVCLPEGIIHISFFICQTKYIIGGYIIQPGKYYEQLAGQIALTAFIAVILRLSSEKKLSYLLLRIIIILPQISYPFIISHNILLAQLKNIRLDILTL